jgi:hypothetical protein
MTDDIKLLLEEARANVANAADSMPPGSVRESLLRGEGADERLSLIVRLSNALSERMTQDGDAEQWALDAFPRHVFPHEAGDALRIAYTRGWRERPYV